MKSCKTAYRIFDLAVSLVYPRRCPICDRIVIPYGQLIHSSCQKKVQYVDGPTCLKCGKPINNDYEEYCTDCRKIRHFFDKGYSTFKYRSISGSVYRLKYMGRQEYADYYAREIEKRLGPTLKSLNADAIIPVPMYRLKENQRGYNQAVVLSKSVGRILNIPVRTDVITRCRNTVPMKELDIMERRKNLKKAFIMSGNDVKLNCVIILDDIYTTGSTIDEMARMFRRAGVRRVYALTLAIGQTT